jgi:hypothetical protein
MLELFPNFTEYPQGAKFSALRNRRYILWRIWDGELPLVLFIGINPSIADEFRNDQTIGKLIRVVKSWDYGGFFIGNLSSKISNNPKEIRDPDSVYTFDNEYLIKAEEISEAVIFIWGNEGKRFLPRIDQIRSLFPVGYCFKQNANGHPCHPLYLAEKDLQLSSFNWNML